ncbi:MAG: hypothetical protein IID32_08120, partial [Planctomycetes bacterium]|nr:hypothetical protein [Planctomycetota bacterium]
MTLETQALTKLNITDLLKAAQEGVTQFLRQSLDQGEIDDQLFSDATQAVMPNLEQWLQNPQIDRVSPNAKQGIALAIQAGNWKGIVNAFRRDLGFGTGGIRGMMGLEYESIVRLKEEGIDAPILKGPNTLNNIVLLRISSGVARFAVNKGFSKVVVGFDSRIRGQDFAQAIAELFLAYGFTGFMFDEPC